MNINAARVKDNPRRRTRLLHPLLAVALLFTAPAWAAGVFRVDGTSSAVAPDGQSWTTAYKTLQAGVDAAYAAGGGEVWAKAGVYTAATNPVLVMRPEVSLYGGFAGSETARGERNWPANVTVIDGANARRCVNGTDNAALDGFTITRGHSDGGGGMKNDHASPTVSNCVFTQNSAVSFGGGMYNALSSPTVTNCLFTQNTCGHKGGGMNNFSSSPVVTNCTFALNTATAYGGGMYNTDASSSPKVTNCILWSDTAQNGPEVFNDSSVPELTHSCVQGGFAGTGNISVNPLFLDESGGSVQLRSASPCLDAGTATGAPAADTLGRVRPQGAGVDMGAYEGSVAPGDIVSLTIQVFPFDGGFTSPAAGIHSYVRGETAAVTVQPRGMRWITWSGAVSSTETRVALAMDADKVLVAYFGTNIIYVDAGNTALPRDGRSWATAFTDIQSGVDTAQADGGGEVWVKKGTYIAATGPVVTMKPTVSLYGGFEGTEDNRYARDWSLNLTVIDGQNARCCVIGADHAVLDGFTVKRGVSADGGGMHNSSASPTVSNCIFTGNRADNGGGTGISHGGGMYNFSSMPVVSHCTFTLNTTAGNNGVGAGMFNAASSPRVEFCQFSSNTAAGTASSGGGMFNSSFSSPTVTDSSFSGNTASSGGGMANSSSTPTLTGCAFSGNSASTGGGMASNSSAPTVTNCSFSTNSAAAGGGMHNDASAPVVTGCSFSGNTVSLADPAIAYGGGMCNAAFSTPTVVNCAFFSNRASCGGGMGNLSSSPVVTNCTFTLNTATGGTTPYGGGIYNTGASSAPKITNCILWNDSATTGPEIYDASSSIPTVAYSCVQGGYAGTGNIIADPLFVAAPANLRLQDPSPCINTATADNAPPTDIRGVPRPQGTGRDMGIYEMIPVTAPPVILTCPGSRFLSLDDSCQASVPNFTAGLTAADDHDSSLTITQSPAAGTAAAKGNTTVTLTVTNDAGLFSTCTATLIVADLTPPEIMLLGENPVTVECHTSYTESGATAADNCTGNMTGSIIVTNLVNPDIPGTYFVLYNVSDEEGNSAQDIRTVIVSDTQEPVITRLGDAAVTIECRSGYLDPGATAWDLCAGDLNVSIAADNPVNTSIPGTYTVRYNVNDGDGNSAAEVTRTVTVADTAKPVISLLDTTPVTVECHTTYTDAGATATDLCAGNLTASIAVTNTVNANTPGAYTVRYNVNDGNGNSAAEVTRIVNVVDSTRPIIALGGEAFVTVECNTFFLDPGSVANDTCAGNLTGSVVITNPVNIGVLGTYTLRYSVSDGNGNTNEVQRWVTVRDTTRPVISLLGSATVSVECHSTYTDAGAIATDICAGNVTGRMVVTNPVNVNVPGTYTVRYNVNDGNSVNNNAIEVTRTVNVVDTTKPVITPLGTTPISLECGSTYTDAGATAADNCAGSRTANITVTNPVNVHVPGLYTVRYNVNDGNGNSAAEVTRTVTVTDTAKPVLTLLGGAAVSAECGAPYDDPGATADDTCVGSLTASIAVTNPVDVNTPGVYTVSYGVDDGNGNPAVELTRTVTVADTAKPVVTLAGSAQVTLDCGQAYSDAGATALDLCAGDLTSSIAASGLPLAGPLGPGTWTVTYNVADANGQVAATVSRTLTVRDNCTLAVNAVGDTFIHTALDESVAFSVAATGAVGSVSYQWTKKGGSGSGNTFDNIPGATHDTLAFDPVDAESVGLYRCAVSDAVTTVNGPVFTVTFAEPVPAAGPFGLAVAAVALGIGGAFIVRRRRR